jgi:uncharacterized membrane protein
MDRSRAAKDTCTSCGKRGYYKLGICGTCRMCVCTECNKALRKSYIGQKRCSPCERKWQDKVTQAGGIA